MNYPIVLQLDPTPFNARNSEGAFVTLKDGRILFAWSKFLSGKGGDNEPSVIVSRTSDDGGHTWSETERVLAAPQEGMHNLMSVSLLRLHDGRIALLYAGKKNLPGGIIQCRPLICFSDDEMATLSAPSSLTLSTDYHVVNNDRMIQLQNGTLVVPVAHHRFRMPYAASGQPVEKLQFNHGGLIFFLLSHDGGASWIESENNFYRCFPDAGGLQEPGVIELKDGRLWAWARSTWLQGETGKRQWQSFSHDGGRIWSEPEPSIFISPCSPLSVKRIPSTGDLLAVWNDHSGRYPAPENPRERRPLACAVSADEGKSWKHHQLLEDAPGHGFHYTAIHFVEDAVLLAYCAGGPPPQRPLARLRMRRILLSDIYSS